MSLYFPSLYITDYNRKYELNINLVQYNIKDMFKNIVRKFINNIKLHLLVKDRKLISILNHWERRLGKKGRKKLYRYAHLMWLISVMYHDAHALPGRWHDITLNHTAALLSWTLFVVEDDWIMYWCYRAVNATLFCFRFCTVTEQVTGNTQLWHKVSRTILHVHWCMYINAQAILQTCTHMQ